MLFLNLEFVSAKKGCEFFFGELGRVSELEKILHRISLPELLSVWLGNQS